MVALARHHDTAFGSPTGAATILTQRPALDAIAEAFAARATAHRYLPAHEQAALRTRVRNRCIDLLDTWYKLADAEKTKGAQLQYGTELPNQPSLLHGFLDESLAALPPDFQKFRANRSMRDVEASVDLFTQTLRG
jgi:hypothetical protein